MLLDDRFAGLCSANGLVYAAVAPVIAESLTPSRSCAMHQQSFSVDLCLVLRRHVRLLQRKSDVESQLQTERQNRDSIDQLVQMLSLSWSRKSQVVETDRQNLKNASKFSESELFPGEEPGWSKSGKKAELDQLGQKIDANQQRLQVCQKELATAESSRAEKSIRQQSMMAELKQTSAEVDRWINECSALSESERTRETDRCHLCLWMMPGSKAPRQTLRLTIERMPNFPENKRSYSNRLITTCRLETRYRNLRGLRGTATAVDRSSSSENTRSTVPSP